MGCNCKSAAARREMLRTTRSSPTRDGGYLLMSYPGCTDLHTGDYRGESVLVVGRNTEHERLFLRTDLTAATQHAIAHTLSIENIPCSGLCDQAVMDLYALV